MNGWYNTRRRSTPTGFYSENKLLKTVFGEPTKDKRSRSGRSSPQSSKQEDDERPINVYEVIESSMHPELAEVQKDQEKRPTIIPTQPSTILKKETKKQQPQEEASELKERDTSNSPLNSGNITNETQKEEPTNDVEVVKTHEQEEKQEQIHEKHEKKKMSKETNIDELMDELNHSSSVPIKHLEQLKSSVEKSRDPSDTSHLESTWSKRKDLFFINGDLRYFPLHTLGGDFDVVLIDPPWRIRGNENASTEKSLMFNNSHFSLNYNTLSNEEILDIDVGCLSKAGLLFLWVINSQIPLGFECMQKWGYSYADKIVWVKKTSNNNLAIGQGYYFLHSTETCLIGIKNQRGEKNFQFISKVNNDVLFAPVRKKSQKPIELYELIEKMVPGGKKIELFARNHNLRPGWLSIGNQLGEYFDWDHDKISCDTCGNSIEVGSPRYKSKETKNKDLCETCFKKNEKHEEDFFKIGNVVNEMVFHDWFSCNSCGITPIWGLRFHCKECQDLDICEECFDLRKEKILENAPDHDLSHDWEVVELPERAGGFAVHQRRCNGCSTYPIIGYCFSCDECKCNLCEKCFFMQKEPKSHQHTHHMKLIVESEALEQPRKCITCFNTIKGVYHKCNSCLNFVVCDKCHEAKLPPPPSKIQHKQFHTLRRIEPAPKRGRKRKVQHEF